MKKLVLVAILGFGVFGVANLNAENLSDEQLNQLLVDCVNNGNKNSCQRLTNSGSLINVEQCDKETCNNIGRAYFVAKNYQQALKYFKKACELNDKFGCGNLAILYDTGQGIKQDFAKAFKFNKKACDLNLSSACFNLGFMYAKGQGVRQDFVNARKYYEKACNENYANACNNLGVLYSKGQGVRQNKSTAKKYYGKACDLGFQIGCYNYIVLDEQVVK